MFIIDVSACCLFRAVADLTTGKVFVRCKHQHRVDTRLYKQAV